MKSEVIQQNKQPEYPRLMQSEMSSAVVLFTAEKEGFIVSGKGWNGKGIGHYSDNWRMESFQPFYGEVKLSN